MKIIQRNTPENMRFTVPSEKRSPKSKPRFKYHARVNSQGTRRHFRGKELAMLGCLAWCAVSAAQVGEIGFFLAPERAIPVSGNPAIAPDSGSTLIPRTSVADIRGSMVLLRRRFGAEEYGLYEGRKRPDSFLNMSAFIPPGNKKPVDFVRTRFYQRKELNFNNDIVNVYFDDTFLYVENTARIYYFDHGWQSLLYLPEPPAFLQVQTLPPGADIYLNSEFKGAAPLTLGPLQNPSVLISTRKNGFYASSGYAVVAPGTREKITLILSRMPDQVNGVYMDPTRFTAEDEAGIERLLQRIEEIKELITMQDNITESASRGFDEAFEALSPQGEFEKTDAFLERKKAYEQRQAQLKDEYLKEENARVAQLQRELRSLSNHYADLKNRLYHRYFVPGNLALERYDPDHEFFPVSIDIQENQFSFLFTGKLFIPIDRASDFKNNITDGRLRLTYTNVIRAEESGISLSYKIEGFTLIYKGIECELQGSFAFRTRS